mmetsp:Transcript_126128/g.318337  ORF Transcript_126128/g.318337 Transcript_126128/m.318337 type:complete len:1019 (-) Transcript_126128:74-3130(-)
MATDSGPAAASTVPGAAGEAQMKSPVQIRISNTEERSSMLKSFTVYIVQISDFGRSYQIERRFDDFAKLHTDLVTYDSNLPPLPEKKMWASTDASTVAERKPAFEKILRYMLRSEEIVMEKSQALWKFLEMPPPGVVAARYMFKTHRLNYARQCGKLLDPKYEREHAYRLAHESVIKTNLLVLASELDVARSEVSGARGGGGGAADAASDSAKRRPDPMTPGSGTDSSSAPAAGSGGGGGGDGDAASSTPTPGEEQGAAPTTGAVNDAEAAAIEMLRWAIANGGEAARKAFFEEQGVAKMLTLLFSRGRDAAARAASGEDIAPHPQIRSVMNALVKAEGERYPKVFAQFLTSGGVKLLSDARDVFQSSQGFSEFISKLLWIAWDEETQTSFLQEPHDKEALGLLSALFPSPSRTARVCAGLLLSCLLASQLLEGKEAQAAAGVYSLVEEMVNSSPAWIRDADGTASDKAKGGKIEAELTAFFQSLGQNEDRFVRILNCADAPWRLNEGNLPNEESPLWACCTFALWCLLKMRPKPARLANLRMALPTVAQAAPHRARWLAGELLLMLQLQSPAHLGDNSPFGEVDAVVEMTYQESAALEVALREQVDHSRQNLRLELEQNQVVISSQRALTQERQTPPALSQQPWHKPLDEVLRNLCSVRNKLTGMVTAAETSSETACGHVRDVLQLELGGDGADADDGQLTLKLDGMREIEASYLAKKRELAECQETLKQQDKLVEDANAAMERADGAVKEARRQISDLESQISAKQRDAQGKRTMASSDFSALKGQVMAEIDTIKQKQAKIRERAQKIQAGEPLKEGGTPLDATAAQEEMGRLKAEAAQLKARHAELQAEQARIDTDPATLEQQARASEEAVQRLSQERDDLRGGLHDLENEHAQARQIWQESVSHLQGARQASQLAERECSGLKQQLDAVWVSWQPLWARRLQAWQARVLSLSQAQQGGRELAQAVGRSWEGLRTEKDLRIEVLSAVQALQGELASLAQELCAVDDQALDALDEQ